MRAAGIQEYRGAVGLLELADPPPQGGDAVIAVRAAGVGNWDETVRVEEWDVGYRPPKAPGVELHTAERRTRRHG